MNERVVNDRTARAERNLNSLALLLKENIKDVTGLHGIYPDDGPIDIRLSTHSLRLIKDVLIEAGYLPGSNRED